MFVIKSDIVLFLIFIHVCKCERRIQDGAEAKADKPYVVYFVKAPLSKLGYDYWLCGGALVTSEFVVTSAACIKDVDYLYVIAGYKKYVTDDQIDLDPCTSKHKKKVIYTCYPKGYELRYDQLDVWSQIDIGVAKVESPYDFEDQTYKTICSYIPGIIPISYDTKYQEPGIDAVVFGWGHKFEWRKQDDKENYNQQNLNYAPVMIIDKTECRRHYEDYGRMREVIDTYMICTLEGGNLDDFGERHSGLPGQAPLTLLDGCATRKSSALNPDEAMEDCEEDYKYDETRRQIKQSNHSSNNSMLEIRNKNNGNKTRAVPNRTTVPNITGLTNRSALTDRTASFDKPFISNKTVVFNETVRDTRRYGICQNDHGGPLVTWVGAHETLIGVASVFKVSDKFKCTGPYLFTSTQCNGAFLDCILSKTNFDFRRSSDTGIVFNNTRRSLCRKSINHERHPMVERHISWLYHPAGAADHERHLKHEKHGPHANERAPEMYEENVNESERSVNLANKMNSPLNEKKSANVNDAPNERYTANNKHIPNGNNAPNINDDGAPYNKYVANYEFAPGVPMLANNNYRPYNIPASNSGSASNNVPPPNNKPVQNNGPAQVNRPTLNYGSDQMNYHASNNNPAPNHGPAQEHRPTLNNEPAQNNGPAPKNGPAQLNRPTLNYRSDQMNYHAPNNNPAPNHGPAQKYGPTLNNGPAQNNGPTQNNWPAPNYRAEPDNQYAN